MQHTAAAVKPKTSRTRRVYISQLMIRCLVLAACILIVIFDPQQTEILQG
jgi:hypothetical protein